MAKLLTVHFAVLLAVGAAFPGVHKGQKAPPATAFIGDEALSSSVVEVKQSVVYPASPLTAPGDSIMYTTYDYQTNGSVCRNIINYGNGIVSFARMMAQGVGSTPPDRGSWYNFSTNGGRTWQHPWGRVENSYHGWSNIDQVRDFGGLEVIATHRSATDPLTVSVDAEKGANSWLASSTGGSGFLYPRLAIGSGAYFHVISGTGGGPISGLGYTRTTDGGLTFDRVGVNIFPSNAGIRPGAFAASARGNKVAFLVVGEGNDVVLLVSTNRGDTWSTMTIYEVVTPPPEPQFQPDGSCDVLIDSAGVVHVVWSNFLRDSMTLHYSIDVPIMYWNSASQVLRSIAYPIQDTTMVVPPRPGGAGGVPRFGNYATQPDLGVSSDGSTIYCTYSALIQERDLANLNFSHVYAVKSTDGGTTWGPAIDITPGTGFDAAWPTIPDLVEDTLYLAYFADRLAGNFIRGNHAQTQVAVMWLRVPVSEIPTGVREPGGGIPSVYALEQNYPNPFNPTTVIGYSLPAVGRNAIPTYKVTLKVYNVLGQEVATLVNGVKQAGRYEVQWNPRGLPSGVYMYRLTAGAFTTTRKLVLLR